VFVFVVGKYKSDRKMLRMTVGMVRCSGDRIDVCDALRGLKRHVVNIKMGIWAAPSTDATQPPLPGSCDSILG